VLSIFNLLANIVVVGQVQPTGAAEVATILVKNASNLRKEMGTGTNARALVIIKYARSTAGYRYHQYSNGLLCLVYGLWA
jgi:hypothetical protein